MPLSRFASTSNISIWRGTYWTSEAVLITFPPANRLWWSPNKGDRSKSTATDFPSCSPSTLQVSLLASVNSYCANVAYALVHFYERVHREQTVQVQWFDNGIYIYRKLLFCILLCMDKQKCNSHLCIDISSKNLDVTYNSRKFHSCSIKSRSAFAIRLPSNQWLPNQLKWVTNCTLTEKKGRGGDGKKEGGWMKK